MLQSSQMLRRNRSRHQSGFTIIELTLAMTFLAFVMIFSATVIIQLTNTYMKGLTIKQINQAGRSINDDLARSLRLAASGQINTGLVEDGMLCVGKSAYIWNPVYRGTNFNDTGLNAHQLAGSPISLARVTSDDVDDCQDPSAEYDLDGSVDRVSLLGGRSRVLSATATRSAVDPKLVNIHFYLGTFDANEATDLEDSNFEDVTNSAYLRPGVSHADGPIFTCRDDRFGNFCAFSEFSTTVYVTR